MQKTNQQTPMTFDADVIRDLARQLSALSITGMRLYSQLGMSTFASEMHALYPEFPDGVVAEQVKAIAGSGHDAGKCKFEIRLDDGKSIQADPVSMQNWVDGMLLRHDGAKRKIASLIKDLQREVEERNEHADKRRELGLKLEAVKSELGMKLGEVKERLHNTEEALKKMNEENVKLTDEYNDAVLKAGNLEAELAEANNKHAADKNWIMAANHRQQKVIADLRAEVKEERERANKLAAENDRIMRESNNCLVPLSQIQSLPNGPEPIQTETTLKALTAELATAKAQRSEYYRMAHNAQDQLQDLRAKADEEITKLSAEVFRVKELLNKRNERIDELTDEYNKQLITIARLERDVAEAKGESTDAKS